MKKYIFLPILLLGLLLPFKVVAAENYKEEFSSTYSIKENFTTSVRFTSKVTSTSETTLIDSFTINIPYTDATNVNVFINGGVVLAEKVNGEDGIEVTVDLGISPQKKDEGFVVDTLFDTKQVVSDFYGLKRVVIQSVNKSLNVTSRQVIIPKTYPRTNGTDWLDSNQMTGDRILELKGHSGAYLTFGLPTHLNFVVDQKLINTQMKATETYFPLPSDDVFQSTFFYPINSKDRLMLDGALNKNVFINLKGKEEKKVEITGVLLFRDKSEEINTDEYLSTTEVWDFNKQNIADLVGLFTDSDNKIKEIYEYVLENFGIKEGVRLDREKVSEIVEKETISEIEMSDLLVALLRGNGIPARGMIGIDLSNRNIDQLDSYSFWVQYYDNGKWNGLDPYFFKERGFEDFSFFNRDRVSFFVIDGNENKEDLGNLFINTSSYLSLFEFELDSQLIEKEFEYDFIPDVPEKVSLNVRFPIEIKLKNNSSGVIYLSSVQKIGGELYELEVDKSSIPFLLPGQTSVVTINEFFIKGLFTNKIEEFRVKVELKDLSGNTYTENFTVTVTAVPTLRSFLSVILSIAVGSTLLISLYIIGRRSDKKKRRLPIVGLFFKN